MKMPRLFLLLMLYPLIYTVCGCHRDTAGPLTVDTHSVLGFWEKELKSERIIFFIDRSGQTGYRGVVVTLRGKNIVHHAQLENIAVDGVSISMVTNAERDIVYTGKLDTSMQTLTGELQYKNGKTTLFNLTRYAGRECADIRKLVTDSGAPLYKKVEQLPEMAVSSASELELKTEYLQSIVSEGTAARDDMVAVVNRWHGEIFPDHPERSSALLTAFLLDPVVGQIAKQWEDILAGNASTEQKIQLINQWNISRMTFTQIESAFAHLPGKDPWGTMKDGSSPTFKKLIPSEMKAMQQHTGKISGKCFTLVNLISSCFVRLGVDPDDIVVLITSDGAARHAVALVKLENNIVLVNLMMVDFLKNSISKNFNDYDIIGLYNHHLSTETDFRLSKTDLRSMLDMHGNTMLQTVIDQFHLDTAFLQKSTSGTVYSSRDELYTAVFQTETSLPDRVLAKYAYQSLYVKHPECYLTASLRTEGPKKLSETFSSDREIFEWIRHHIRYGSIFPDSGERLMTADQVLVFQQGSYKDQAVLAATLLMHRGRRPVIHLFERTACVEVDGTVYDLQMGETVKRLPADRKLVIHAGQH